MTNVYKKEIFKDQKYRIYYDYTIFESNDKQTKNIKSIFIFYKNSEMSIEICPRIGSWNDKKDFVLFIRPLGQKTDDWYLYTRRCHVSSEYGLNINDIDINNEEYIINKSIALADILGQISYQNKNPWNADHPIITTYDNFIEHICFPSIDYANMSNKHRSEDEEIILEEHENEHALKIIINSLGQISIKEWILVNEKEIAPGIKTDEFHLFEKDNIATITKEQLDIFFSNDHDLKVKEYDTIIQDYCNKFLHDPFVYPDDPRLKEKELEWVKGSQEELIDYIKTIIYSHSKSPNLLKEMIVGLQYYPADYKYDQNFGPIEFYYDTSYKGTIDYKKIAPIEKEFIERLKKYTDIIFDRVKAIQWKFAKDKYNQLDKESNYDIRVNPIDISIPKPTNHEIIDSKIKLKKLDLLYERYKK